MVSIKVPRFRQEINGYQFMKSRNLLRKPRPCNTGSRNASHGGSGGGEGPRGRGSRRPPAGGDSARVGGCAEYYR